MIEVFALVAILLKTTIFWNSDFAMLGDKCQLHVPAAVRVMQRLETISRNKFAFICFPKHIYRMQSTYYA